MGYLFNLLYKSRLYFKFYTSILDFAQMTESNRMNLAHCNRIGIQNFLVVGYCEGEDINPLSVRISLGELLRSLE